MSDVFVHPTAVVDEPVGNKRTLNYATGGWVAAPVVGKVVSRMAPIVGIAPAMDIEIEPPKISVQKAAPKPRRSGVAKTRQAVYRPDAKRWADDVARAVGMTPARQAAAEAELVLQARKALTHAVTARDEHRQLLSRAVSLVERDGASR